MSRYKLKIQMPFHPVLGTVVIEDSCGYITINKVRYRAEDYPHIWEKIERGLITSEDDVELFKGDSCWVVTKFNEYSYYNNKYVINDDFVQITGSLIFSTRKAGDEYISKNKVLFYTENGEAL